MTQDHPSEESVYRYPIPDGESASRTAYLAVAQAKECDPMDLPPLGLTIDADALDALVGTSTPNGFTTTFEYAGYSVTVTADEIRLSEG